ncbi:MAG: energy-coupling factor transporter transmembrane component T, partial [Chloroflexota bacterium]
RALGRRAAAGRNGGDAHAIPLLVPVTINAIVGAEDTIDAMDLRGFGTGRRTWLRELVFDRTDVLVLLGFAVLLLAVTILSQTGHTQLWVPQALIDLAR